MLSLRMAAVLSCLFFTAYAAMSGKVSADHYELTLPPISGYQLFELPP